MNALAFHRLMRGQLDRLRREGLLDAETHARLADRYPVSGWDWHRLGRWFAAFGAASAAAGGSILAAAWFEFTLVKLAWVLGLVMAGCFGGGWRLDRLAPRFRWTRLSLEALGGMTLIGLTFTLGLIFSSGSGNWPALLLIDLIILLPLAYARHNGLLVVLALVVFFTWFGGMTGYISGWGAYWFGMNYPMRFLLAGAAIAGLGLLHRQAEDGPLSGYRDFFKIWLSGGLFFMEMALWLMSLFGNYGTLFSGHQESGLELLVFNVLWAGFNLALLRGGARHGLRMVRGYAVTFGVIQAYTLYFWQVAGHLGPVFGTFIAGCVTLAGVIWFERRRRDRATTPPPA